jgi:hypothetical protein
MISSCLLAIGCAFIGFVRFVRWAWG